MLTKRQIKEVVDYLFTKPGSEEEFDTLELRDANDDFRWQWPRECVREILSGITGPLKKYRPRCPVNVRKKSPEHNQID